jgi:hypothetical protein
LALLSARLERLPTTRYTYVFVLLLAGALFIEAFDIGSLSVILPILKPLMHLRAVVQFAGLPILPAVW